MTEETTPTQDPEVEETTPTQDPEVDEDTQDPEVDEDTGLAPGPEQPVDVELHAEDAGTAVGPLHVRDVDVDVPDDAAITADPASDLHPEVDKTRAERAAFDKDAESEAIEGEQVEYVQGVSGTYALALQINGQTFLFNRQTVGALKQVVDQTVVGLAL